MTKVHAQESPASVTEASHVGLISQTSDNAVDSCTAAAGEATLAVPSPPANSAGSDTSGTEKDSDTKSKETADTEDTVSAQGVKVENAGNNACM